MTAKKDTVNLLLTCCDQCPHCKQSRWYTVDSFENVTAWNCAHPKFAKLKQGTTDREEWRDPPGIARQDWNDKPPPIPKWCPLRKKRNS
jgi:hypothetical protein